MPLEEFLALPDREEAVSPETEKTEAEKEGNGPEQLLLGI